MIEQEWLQTDDPNRLWVSIPFGQSDRKLRLFACACCRRIWNELGDDRSQHAVLVAERFADGRASLEDLNAASAAADDVWRAETEQLSTEDQEQGLPLTHSAAAYNVAIPIGWWGAAPAFVAPHEIILEVTQDREEEAKAQCALFRDIFGNPFRPVTLDPRWLSTTVLDLAGTIYDERVWERMPILADALMDAGCDSEEIIEHCQGPKPHVRGCFVVDLLLGKE